MEQNPERIRKDRRNRLRTFPTIGIIIVAATLAGVFVAQPAAANPCVVEDEASHPASLRLDETPDPNWIAECAQEIADEVLAGLEPTAHLTGWVTDAACQGEVEIVDRASAEADYALRLSGLLGETANLAEDARQLEEPRTPLPVLALIGLALLIFGTAITLATWEVAKAEAAKEPWAEYVVTCTAIGYGFHATGAGGVMRRVAIEAPLGGQMQEIGKPCTYDGVVATACITPATHRNDGGAVAGVIEGSMRVKYNEDANRWEYETPLPVVGQACLDMGVRAVNSFQTPLLNQVQRPTEDGLDNLECATACIVWADKQECRPPDE